MLRSRRFRFVSLFIVASSLTLNGCSGARVTPAVSQNPSIRASLANICTWKSQHLPNVGTAPFLNRVASFGGNAWAVGLSDGGKHAFVLAFAKGKWSAQTVAEPSKTANVLNGISADSANDVWAAGGSYDSSAYEQPLLEHFANNKWSVVNTLPLASGYNGFVSVNAYSPTDVWAAGSQTGYGGRIGLLEHFDGSSWMNALPQGSITPAPSGIYTVDDAAVYLGGTPSSTPIVPINTTNSSGGTAGLAYPSGQSGQWSLATVPNPPGLPYATISAIESAQAGSVLLAGWFGLASKPQVLLESWNGTSFTRLAVPGGGAHEALSSVAFDDPADAMAVGEKAGRNQSPYAIAFDGKSWMEVTTPSFKGAFYSIAPIKGTTNFWVGGNTTSSPVIYLATCKL